MRTWAEINLDNLKYNLDKIKSLVGNKGIMGVVKADAYGHGAVEMAREMSRNGVRIFGVACLEEGRELRLNGIKDEILILGCTPVEEWATAVELDLTLTIASEYEVEEIKRRSINPKVHIVIDTGMGRIGFEPEEGVKVTEKLIEEGIARVEGVFSHLSSADMEEEREYTLEQLKKFEAFKKMNLKYRHILNSAGCISYNTEDTISNFVKPGLILYGIMPFDSEENYFKTVLNLKSKIVFLKEIKTEKYISYQKKYMAKKGEVIATIPVGYADGFSRKFSNHGTVSIRGIKCPIVGNICMDQMMVSIPEELKEKIGIGEEVLVYGEDYNEKASEIGSIAYEMLTTISTRVERIYIRGNKIVGKRTLLEREWYETN